MGALLDDSEPEGDLKYTCATSSNRDAAWWRRCVDECYLRVQDENQRKGKDRSSEGGKGCDWDAQFVFALCCRLKGVLCRARGDMIRTTRKENQNGHVIAGAEVRSVPRVVPTRKRSVLLRRSSTALCSASTSHRTSSRTKSYVRS